MKMTEQDRAELEALINKYGRYIMTHLVKESMGNQELSYDYDEAAYHVSIDVSLDNCNYDNDQLQLLASNILAYLPFVIKETRWIEGMGAVSTVCIGFNDIRETPDIFEFARILFGMTEEEVYNSPHLFKGDIEHLYNN